MKDLKLFINESQEIQYNVPVKELYRISVEQGIKDHESWDKNWEKTYDIYSKPDPNKLSVDGCFVIRCKIENVKYPQYLGGKEEYMKKEKEYSKKVCEIFKKYWDNNINVTRTYTTSVRERFYEFKCVFDKDTIITIDYMGALKDLNKYKV